MEHLNSLRCAPQSPGTPAVPQLLQLAPGSRGASEANMPAIERFTGAGLGVPVANFLAGWGSRQGDGVVVGQG
ncbi:hypothetical protein P7K49_005837, partial [Saguinus oedipus]